jgi:hypothetical protein
MGVVITIARAAHHTPNVTSCNYSLQLILVVLIVDFSTEINQALLISRRVLWSRYRSVHPIKVPVHKIQSFIRECVKQICLIWTKKHKTKTAVLLSFLHDDAVCLFWASGCSDLIGDVPSLALVSSSFSSINAWFLRSLLLSKMEYLFGIWLRNCNFYHLPYTDYPNILRACTFWIPGGLSRPVQGQLYLYLTDNCFPLRNRRLIRVSSTFTTNLSTVIGSIIQGGSNMTGTICV